MIFATSARIRRARTRIFKQILREMPKCLAEYPVARAVNDAFRYAR